MTDIPARAVIVQLMAGKQIAFSLAGVARLGVADHMSEGPVAVEVLASEVDAQPDALFRVMRCSTSRCLVMTPGGRERTAEEFRALLASADLRLSRIVETALPICVVEAVRS
jgi:hypothetical protein